MTPGRSWKLSAAPSTCASRSSWQNRSAAAFADSGRDGMLRRDGGSISTSGSAGGRTDSGIAAMGGRATKGHGARAAAIADLRRRVPGRRRLARQRRRHRRARRGRLRGAALGPRHRDAAARLRRRAGVVRRREDAGLGRGRAAVLRRRGARRRRRRRRQRRGQDVGDRVRVADGARDRLGQARQGAPPTPPAPRAASAPRRPASPAHRPAPRERSAGGLARAGR